MTLAELLNTLLSAPTLYRYPDMSLPTHNELAIQLAHHLGLEAPDTTSWDKVRRVPSRSNFIQSRQALLLLNQLGDNKSAVLVSGFFIYI